MVRSKIQRPRREEERKVKRIRARRVGDSLAVMGDTAGREEMERRVEGVCEVGVRV